jgi:Flp pilus assembly protein TadG
MTFRVRDLVHFDGLLATKAPGQRQQNNMIHHRRATMPVREQTTRKQLIPGEIKNARRSFVLATLRPTSRRSGSVVVIAALSLVALTGMCALAVDYGLLVSDANRLQRACDAAALAGATYLKSTGNDQTDVSNARIAAAAMMGQHKINGFDSSTITFNSTWSRITVPAKTTRNFFFAGIFKMLAPSTSTAGISTTTAATSTSSVSSNAGTIARHATAGRTALKGVPQVSPLAITIDDFLLYRNGTSFENILIANNQQNFVPGTLTAIDLRLDNSGKSGAAFQEDLTWGTAGTTVIGQAVNSALNADLNSEVAKLERAMQDRMTRAAGAPWYDNGSNTTYPNYANDNPRTTTIMVANPNPANNNNPMLTALFFVSVYVEQIRTPGSGKGYLRMRILPTNTFNSDRSDIIAGDENAPITGPSVISLTD